MADRAAAAGGAFFPFGGGRRRLCIGERFATTEAVLAIATIARRWAIVPHRPAPRLDPRFTLRTRGGLEATIRRR
ncbi:MAG TPA: cytochrome P450 [Gaiellales bacterium]|nr:cytochrome P450 [Gaiellales bacterium]